MILSLIFKLKTVLRAVIPERGLRVIRGLSLIFTPPPPPSAYLPFKVIQDCRFLCDRNMLLEYLPTGGIVCEVGTQHGNFARHILDICTPTALHLIDISFELLRDDVRTHACVTLHQGSSKDVMAALPDNSFDWIYIDGDHSYQGVKADIDVAMSKVKPGGYLVFNDFARIVIAGLGAFGVHGAVCEFAARECWPMAYFCFEPEGLYDVAFRKPL